MSGLEALYWAQKYPDEVSAIIGLDMAVPEYYDSMNINIPLMRIAEWLAYIGIGSCGVPILLTVSAFSFTRSVSFIIVTVAVRL